MLALKETYKALSVPIDVSVDMVLSAERQAKRRVTAQYRKEETNDDQKNGK